MLLKNKPLMTGLLAVVALLIAGAVYFFVIEDSDSDVDNNTDTDTQVDGQQDPDPDPDPDPGTEDNAQAVLVDMGFDCQQTTIAAEAQARIATAQTIAEEDPGLLAFTQLYAGLIDESGAGDNEITACDHAEKQLSVLVSTGDNAKLHLMTQVQAICTISASQGVSEAGLQAYLQDFQKGFEEDPILDVSSQVYFAESSALTPQTQSASKQLQEIFTSAGVIYTPYPLPVLSCNA